MTPHCIAEKRTDMTPHCTAEKRADMMAQHHTNTDERTADVVPHHTTSLRADMAPYHTTAMAMAKEEKRTWRHITPMRWGDIVRHGNWHTPMITR